MSPSYSTPDDLQHRDTTRHAIRIGNPDIELPYSNEWWATTKRMIVRGSRRFWTRRGYVHEPGTEAFRRATDLEMQERRAVQRHVAAQEAL